MALDVTIYSPEGATLWTRSLPIGVIERWSSFSDGHPLAWGGAWHTMSPTPITTSDVEHVEGYARRAVCPCDTCSLCRTFSLDLVRAARSAPPSSMIEAN